MTISPYGWKEDGPDLRPSRPLSQKTRMEMWAGSKLQQHQRMRENCSPEDYAKYCEWEAGWVLRADKGKV